MKRAWRSLGVAVMAAMLLALPGTARAAESGMQLDLQPGGSLDLQSGMWAPEGGAATWCDDSTSCQNAVTLLVPAGDGPVTVRSSPQHPLVFNLKQFQAVSVAGECAIDVATRSDSALAGTLRCNDVPRTTGGTIDVRGRFAVDAAGTASSVGGPGIGELPDGTFAGDALGLPSAPLTVPQGFEIIDSYDVALVIRPDGLLDVTETIRYDFGSEERHGIERVIPVRYRWDDTFDRVLPIDDVTVSSDAPSDVERTSGGGNLALRIGDPDRTVSGMHTYTIRYTAAGALNGDKDDPTWDGDIGDHDELYWNAIGTEWTAPIKSAKVTVTAPAEILEATCYAGSLGSTAECDRTTVRGDQATFSQPGLYPGQGMSVVVAIPVGAVPTPTPILEERWSLGRAFTANALTIGGSLVLLVGLVGGLVWLMWRYGRDRVALGGAVDAAFAGDDAPDQLNPLFGGEGSPVEFAPPEDIRPGQIGTLVDGVANTLDVTATIVDLAARGYLRIEEVPKDGIFGKDDYRLVRLGVDEAALLGYERSLIDGLFDSGGTEVMLSNLRLVFAARLEGVQNALYTDVTKRKWFSARPDRVRQRWALIGFGAFAAAVLVFIAAVVFTKLALLALPLLVAALVLWLGAKWMPQRTAKGTGVLRRSLGFRTFITDSEALRARFAEDQNIFTEYLPYAIVFGCTKKFAKAFEGLEDQMPEQTWYMGTRPFRATVFASDMSSFAVSTGGTLTSTPGSSGSSGFGGGGGSGGGMGGGGGGSW